MRKLYAVFTLMLSFAGVSYAQIGSATSDMVYTPVTPCRIFDTRTSQGGPGAIGAGGIYTFAVSGLANFATQGGKNTNCGMQQIGPNARAIAIYLTVVTPAATGWITAYQNGVLPPQVATVNFKAGDILGNTTIVPVTPGVGAAAGNSYMNVYASSTTDVVGDVVGYYSKPLSLGSLECVNTAIKITNIPTQSYLTENANVCAAGYITTSVTCDGGTGVYINGSGMNSNDPSLGAYCKYVNTAGVDRTTVTSATCCRIPGR